MSIAGLPSGVGGPGRTQYFNFQYDDSLSAARGRDLAADLMNYCDNDLAQISAWFSGRALDMSPPITVSLVSVAKDAAGNPTGDLGASWFGFLAWPLQVTIAIDEFPLTSGTPTMIARYLLASEVSEMYMRAFNAHGSNPWHRDNEGNKGEGLSRFLGIQLLLWAYPGVTKMPALRLPSGIGSWHVTDLWLNSSRENWLEINDSDIFPDPVVGCATLFLFYLHDQLGHRIEDIINAGGGHLSNVYENLTGDSALNAWEEFSELVNSHYPHAGGPTKFTPEYFPPLESIFPVSNLSAFSATLQVSWGKSARPQTVVVGVDRPPKVPLPIRVTSAYKKIIPAPSITIAPAATTEIRPMTVLPQKPGFKPKVVTLRAAYAGKILTTNVTVVDPGTAMPVLDIDVDRTTDPCKPRFIEDDSETFTITNLFVFIDQTGLSFSWSVTGAASGATNTPILTIPTLPAAGTDVTIGVTVTNSQGAEAKGTLSFKTIVLDLEVLDKELRCRLSRFRNLTLSIREWTTVEHVEVRDQELAALKEEIASVSEAMEGVGTVIQRMTQR